MFVQLHVRSSRYHLCCVKRIAGGPPHTKFQRNPSSSFGDTKRGAHVYVYPTINFCKTNQIPIFGAIHPVVSEIRKSRAHVLMCSCAPPLTFVKVLPSGSLTTYQISAQSVLPFPRYREADNICTYARAHVQLCPSHDLRNIYRCLVCKHTPNLFTIGRAIPEL